MFGLCVSLWSSLPEGQVTPERRAKRRLEQWEEQGRPQCRVYTGQVVKLMTQFKGQPSCSALSIHGLEMIFPACSTASCAEPTHHPSGCIPVLIFYIHRGTRGNGGPFLRCSRSSPAAELVKAADSGTGKEVEVRSLEAPSVGNVGLSSKRLTSVVTKLNDDVK